MLKLIFPILAMLAFINWGPKNHIWSTLPASFFLLTFMSLTIIYSPLACPTSSYFMSVTSLNSPLIVLTLWITSLMIWSSFKVKFQDQSPKSFLSHVSTLALVLLLAFSFNNLLTFYIAFELSLVPTLMLVLGWGYQPERIQAGYYLMLYTITASMPLLINIMWLFKTNHHLSFLINSWSIPVSLKFAVPIWWLTISLAFFVKMPIFSSHLWLPKAHVEAPVAGSMILAGLLLKLGSYGLLLISSLFIWPNSTLTPLIASLALWGGSLTSMVCLRQSDMKSLIAYSSIGHMAILIAGLMSNSPWGWEGALVMMIAHGLSSSGLFSIANMNYEVTQSRSLYLNKGMIAIFPTMSLLWFLLTATNMSAPPSINLLAEIMLIASSLFMSIYLVIPLVILTFLSAAYSLILYTSCHHGHPSLFMAPSNLINQRNYTIVFLHLLPIFLIIAAPTFITSWV